MTSFYRSVLNVTNKAESDAIQHISRWFEVYPLLYVVIDKPIYVLQ